MSPYLLDSSPGPSLASPVGKDAVLNSLLAFKFDSLRISELEEIRVRRRIQNEILSAVVLPSLCQFVPTLFTCYLWAILSKPKRSLTP